MMMVVVMMVVVVVILGELNTRGLLRQTRVVGFQKRDSIGNWIEQLGIGAGGGRLWCRIDARGGNGWPDGEQSSRATEQKRGCLFHSVFPTKWRVPGT